MSLKLIFEAVNGF